MVQPQSYAEVGWFSFISYSWLNTLVETGLKRQVTQDDLPELSSEDDPVRSTKLLLHHLDREERSHQTHPLLRAVVKAYWPQLLVLEMLRIVEHCLGLAGPLLLKEVLVFQEAQQKAQQKGNAPTLTTSQVMNGLYAVAGSIALGVVVMIYSSQVNFFQARLGLRIGGALKGAVVARCIQGDLPKVADGGAASGSSRKTTPAVYNVISFDVGPNIDIIWIVLGVWIFPIQLVTAVVALFTQVQWAIFPGLVVIIIAQGICAILQYNDGHFRHQLLAAKDTRLDRCAESFNNVRTLQMLAWTTSFEQQIMAARQEELRIQNSRLWMRKMVAAISYVLTAVVTLVTLAYFVLYIHTSDLKASVAVPVIGLVGGLIGPFAQIPSWMNSYLVWLSAYDRVNGYMGLKAWDGEVAERHRHSDSPDESSSTSIKLEGDCWQAGSLDRSQADNHAVASYEQCSLAWSLAEGPDEKESSHANAEDVESGAVKPLLTPESPATLQDLQLNVRGGELLVLVGQEAQGKSSVLFGLLGEMPLLAGAVRSPAIARRAAEASKPLVLPSGIQVVRDRVAAENAGEGFPASRAHSVCYAGQEPSIHSGNMRSNIIFGSRYDPQLYQQVVGACALENDFLTMPEGDLTEVAQGGATVSGGQKARISLARAVYHAALDLQEQSAGGEHRAPLVLLDDPFCSLDHNVAREVCTALFARPHGLLANAAIIVATADPWWVCELTPALETPLDLLSDTGAVDTGGIANVCVAVLRAGRVAASGSLQDLRSTEDLPELESALGGGSTSENTAGRPSGEIVQVRESQNCENPQEDCPFDDDENAENAEPYHSSKESTIKKEANVQTDPLLTHDVKTKLVQDEHREAGHVKKQTYVFYMNAIGHTTLGITLLALVGIMVFQELTTLWIAYWATSNRQDHFLHRYVAYFFRPIPEGATWLLWVYVGLLVMFVISNFAGHILEIVGGIRAARALFEKALMGTLRRPFRWWDANPTGRVLNRFSQDVQVMDDAITCILGVIAGAVLYFCGHVFILTLTNPLSLLLLPFIAMGFEYIAKYYRKTIREAHRIYLVSMSGLYQGMVEAIINATTIRAFASSERVICHSLDALDKYIRISFMKSAIGSWIGLRMAFVGYTLSVANTLYPVFQYCGLLSPRSESLVGFSIMYSTGISAIIQQFIMNWSDLEMQLVSIERLKEYAFSADDGTARGSPAALFDSRGMARGLQLQDVTVKYREGLRPALRSISLAFSPKETCAIVGRTGAGKSSLLLSVLQLVPYTGHVAIDGIVLSTKDPAEVRRSLVGIVPQRPVIFDGTLRWNLDPQSTFSDKELWNALDAVGLSDICRKSGHGLQALLGEGSQSIPKEMSTGTESVVQSRQTLFLSQGQRQLLCAARALLRRPRVALLDEVSASLPKKAAEGAVATLLCRFAELDATVLLVTHQVDLISSCSRVVTIADGCLVGDRRLRAQ
mmetsp:Transcript_116636/g.212133  ORF Transcript_116636/g.212133 Transcript_116636/m.212133 type:complete len:1461 (+) Transcript_116636:2-4384(+)